MLQYPIDTDDVPKNNKLSGLRFIADFIESHCCYAPDSNRRLSIVEIGQGKNEVQKLLAPFETKTSADKYWSIEQRPLEDAVDAYLKSKDKINLLGRKDYNSHGSSDIVANEQNFMRSLKTLMSNPALTDEQHKNVDKAFDEVCPPNNTNCHQR